MSSKLFLVLKWTSISLSGLQCRRALCKYTTCNIGVHNLCAYLKTKKPLGVSKKSGYMCMHLKFSQNFKVDKTILFMLKNDKGN